MKFFKICLLIVISTLVSCSNKNLQNTAIIKNELEQPSFSNLEEFKAAINSEDAYKIRSLYISRRFINHETSTTETPEAIKSIVHSKRLKNLENLEIELPGLKDKDMQILLKSHAISKLKFLRISACPISDASLKSLAESKYLTNLEELIFDGGTANVATTDAGFVILARSKNISKLKTLAIWGMGITDISVGALSDSCYLKNLTSLNLVGDLTNKAAVYISSSKYLKNLTELYISEGKHIIAEISESLISKKIN